MREHLIAVDIGTTSARAGVFDGQGRLLAKAQHPIVMNQPRENHAEHDSENIWTAACRAVRDARAEAGIDASEIAAIGFDATCSLVVRDESGDPLTVSTGGKARFDTIVWLDHRAIGEADLCTATRHRVLDYAGRSMSPEMQIPKLMWLKTHLPSTWKKSGYFFDLADFLTWKATGSAARSRCTLTAKWNFLAHETPGWQKDFLSLVGLEDLLTRGHLPEETKPPGESVGPLSALAAEQLGLDTQCQVSAGMIDAYAGALGVLGAGSPNGGCLERSVGLIAGTSSCIVAFSGEPKPGKSLWGPYFEATLPGMWLVEGGQSATGALLDHILRMHAAGGEPTTALHGRVVARVNELRALEGDEFAARLHILPDFHGNRSPLADPHGLGVISGLPLDASFDGLCRVYWRACLALALGLRHILEHLGSVGYDLDTLHVTGGHVRNPLLMELYADVIGLRVIVPETSDAVLLGTAMAASVAGRVHADLFAAGREMYPGGREHLPDASKRALYDRDYRRLLAMYRHREELEHLM